MKHISGTISLAALLTLGVLTAAAAPGRAEVVTFMHQGGWKAFGGTGANGRKLCGMSSQGGGRWLGVKYYAGDRTLTVQLSNSAWTLRDGAKVAVTMQFDDESPWRATATGFHMSDGDASLEFDIPTRQLGRWVQEFRTGDALYVRFPNDSVEGWEADLTGTNAIVDRFGVCLRAMGE